MTAVVNTQDILTPQEVHPAFAAEDADIVLCSQDGVHFRTHSLTLKLGSAWFRTLFTLPQEHVSDAASTPIQVAESSQVLADLLGMIAGQGPPQKLDSPEHIARLLHAAEKYEMHGVMATLRLAIVSPALLEKHPVRIYGIACQYNWQEEAKLASSRTIGLDLLSPNVTPELHALDPAHLTRLVLLHRRRWDALRAGLDSTVHFPGNNPKKPRTCDSCGASKVHTNWFRFKSLWFSDIQTSPQGFASLEILHSPDVLDLLDSPCTTPKCQARMYNRDGTVNILSSILKESLPTTVEFE